MDNELYVGDKPSRFTLTKRKLQIGQWVVGGTIVLIVLFIVVLRLADDKIRLEELSALGYSGVFLTMVISGASIFFPVLGQAAVVAAGAVWNPLLVGIAAGVGNATGELTGYFAGRAGAAFFGGHQPPRWWSSIQNWLRRHGFWAIMVLAMIPNPIFDAIGILAGSLSFPTIRQFWLACAIGNSIKYTAVAYLGEFALSLFGIFG